MNVHNLRQAAYEVVEDGIAIVVYLVSGVEDLNGSRVGGPYFHYELVAGPNEEVIKHLGTQGSDVQLRKRVGGNFLYVAEEGWAVWIPEKHLKGRVRKGLTQHYLHVAPVNVERYPVVTQAKDCGLTVLHPWLNTKFKDPVAVWSIWYHCRPRCVRIAKLTVGQNWKEHNSKGKLEKHLITIVNFIREK